MTVSIDVQSIAQRFLAVQTGHLCDALEHAGVLTPQLLGFRPFTSNAKFAGPAVTLRAALSRTGKEPRRLASFTENEMTPGCVAVIDGCGLTRSAMLGGRAAYKAQRYGASGIVVNAGLRDVDELEELGIPVHGIGRSLAPSEGKYMCIGINEPVVIEGVLIRPGDWLVADKSGICVIPQELLMRALELAEEREEMDRWGMEGLKQGKSISAKRGPTWSRLGNV
jgi:regulator of RNase E activity RraA